MRDARDISGRVRAFLIAPLAEKLLEIEDVLRRPVAFLEDATMLAGGAANSQGFIRLAPRAVENISVIGEEIMHLHRWTRGFPGIEPAQLAYMYDYADALLRIGGHFDEYAFFPRLEEWGLDPRSEVLPTLDPQREAILERLPEIQHDGDTARWRVVLSAMFIQPQLVAPPCAARDALLAIFDRTELAPYRVIGQALCEEIVSAQTELPDGVEARMVRSVREHLRLNDRAANVRAFY